MEIAPVQPMALNPSMRAAASAYMKNSSISMNSDSYSIDDWKEQEQVYNLKKELILAIDKGNFQMALYILDKLIELRKK